MTIADYVLAGIYIYIGGVLVFAGFLFAPTFRDFKNRKDFLK